MRINTNINAMTALNQSSKNTALAGAAMGKISSGERINKAGDDAAGMAISEKMRSQIRGLDQASRNTQDGISVVQTAEGAMEEVGNIVQRMRELSVQSSNETNGTEDRAKIAEELTQLHSEIDRIANSTQFNGKNLVNGSDVLGTKTENKLTEGALTQNLFIENGFDLSTIGNIDITTAGDGGAGDGSQSITVAGVAGANVKVDGELAADGTLKAGQKVTITDANGKTLSFEAKADTAAGNLVLGAVAADTTDITGKEIELQVGANTAGSQQLKVTIQNVDTASLELSKAGIDAMKTDGQAGTIAAKNMISNLDKALEKINTSRANLGATQNRLETAQSNLTTSSENLTAAESRIRDVDVAKEMMNLSKLNLLTQASQAMMGQAKQQPEGVMQLLR
jgi:flagellin